MGIAAALVAVFTLTSPAFGNGGTIPARYTCDGANVSPALRWSLPPAGTRSFTLTMQDPDVPQGIFVHWSVTGIPARTRSLPVGAHPGHEGVNDFGERGYGGPCPPRGQTHRYVFVLRALGARGRVLAETRLTGRYARRRGTQSVAAARTVRVWDDQLVSNLTGAQLPFVATHEDGSQKLPRSQIDALHRLNPSFTVLQYRLAIGLGRHTQILDGDRWKKEWPGRVQERWFAHVGGHREYMKQWGWYLTNPDDQSWRAWFTRGLKGEVARTHADGVFLDSASPPNFFGSSAWSPALPALDVPFEHEWSRRIERWLSYVRRAVGKPVIANAGSMITTRDTTDYSRIDGVMIEGFGHGLAPGDWMLQQQRAWRLASRGEIVIAQSYPSNARERLFDVASYLLIRGARTYVNLQTTMQPEWWPEYDLDLGAPITAPDVMLALSTRKFERGVVFVNGGLGAEKIGFVQPTVRLVPQGGGVVRADGVVPSSWTVERVPVTSIELQPGEAAVTAPAGR